MLHLTADDHAFASGPVFQRPGNLLRAWKMTHSLPAGRQLQRLWQQFETRAALGEGLRLGLRARLVNKDLRQTVRIGDNVVCRGILRNERGGRLDIGDRVYIGDGVLLSSACHIVLGDGVMLAHGVQIFDNDSHPIDAAERERHFRMILGLEKPSAVNIGKSPVTIGSRVWIGTQSIVTKGVTIGPDTVVAAGSVVVKDLPAGVLAAGNPARVLRDFKEVYHDQVA